jgi:endonuclease/exonuclease/phosphatase family metal-dependent hydrolase
MDARADSGASHSSVASHRHVAIGSYNVHSCRGWNHRRSPARIAQVLRELDCDIYGLQEVDNEEGETEDSMQLEYLSRALDGCSAGTAHRST